MARRASIMIIFGEIGERWSFPDPLHPTVVQANRAARGYDGGRGANPLVLASVVSALAYLVYDCPTTKLANKKLAMIRRAVRELDPAPGKEGK